MSEPFRPGGMTSERLLGIETTVMRIQNELAHLATTLILNGERDLAGVVQNAHEATQTARQRLLVVAVERQRDEEEREAYSTSPFDR